MRLARLLTASLVVLFLVSAAPVTAPPKVAAQPGLPELWNQLMNPGNRTFRGNAITFGDLDNTRSGLAGGQHPSVTMLSCSDSRVPPELVFYQTLGKLFIVRAAGNVADTFGIASIEYAIKHGYMNLFVVLAHERCGAIEAAIMPDPPLRDQTPSLNALVGRIRLSFTGPPCRIDEEGCWKRRAQRNAFFAVEDLKSRSAVIRKAIDVDKVPVVVAYYNLNGSVEALSPIPTSSRGH